MSRLLLPSITLSLALSLLMLLAMPIGAALNPTPPTLLELAECDFQCWNGIAAGETSINEADRTMEALNYRRVRRRLVLGGGLAAAFALEECSIVFYYIQLIESIHFSACNRIALGDVILMLGIPDAIIYRNALNYELRWQNHRGLIVHVDNWSTPHHRPLRITLSATIDFSNEPRQGSWRGFMSIGRYCLLEQPDGFSAC